jgi:hypothetical protein
VVPDQTRRALLRATGTVTVTGLAGCRFEHAADASDGRDGDGDAGSTRVGADDGAGDGAGAGADGSSDSSDGGDDGGSGGGADPEIETGGAGGGAGSAGGSTLEPGTPFTIHAENRIAATSIETEHEVTTDFVPTVAVDVEVRSGDGTETPFEEDAEVPYGETRTFEDAFTTGSEGNPHSIRAVRDVFPHEYSGDTEWVSDVYRFTPGGFGTVPTAPTITVALLNRVDEGNSVLPTIRIEVPGVDDAEDG